MVAFHVWLGRVSGGVDVFLVLSGFFFGGRLLRVAQQGQRLSLPRELTRLARRLLPALVFVLAVCAVLTVLIQPQTRWEAFADQTLASLGYFQNWHLASTVNDYLRAGEAVSPLQHLWSMSVQGQFFAATLLVVALVTVLGARLSSRLRRGTIVAIVGLAALASFVYANFAHVADQASAYYDTFARAWEPLAGVLAAAMISRIRWPGWLRVSAACLGLVAILLCGVLIDGVREYPARWALVPVGATLLVIFAGGGADQPETRPQLGPMRLLSLPPLVTLGAIGYSLYLWHWPVLILWLAYTDRESAGIVDGAAIIAVSVAAAWLTLRLIEEPLRDRGASVPSAHSRRRGTLTLAAATVLALVSAGLVMASFGWRQHVELVRSSGSELTTLPARDYPGARALIAQARVAKLPMRPSVLEAREDQPATSVDGCITEFLSTDLITCVYGDQTATRTIALAGGSHSEHWITALDLLGRQQGFKVTTYLKMGCPLTTDEVPIIAGSLEPYPECRVWIDDAINRLIADRPDFVFTTTTRPYTDGPGDFVPGNYLGIWDRLAENGIAILGLRDTPWMFRDGVLFSPPDCIAGGGDADSCGLPRSEALSESNPTFDYAGRYPLMSLLDLSDAICSAETCRAVEGNVLVYHDEHHLSATYVRSLADELARQLSDATGWW
ncbi:acyltransferase family protein [Mycolicibacterium mengxianglii]|uniref:acyltransferase family protein n=1 Tax=Mycolicibacterium mengxianglii TaxID=2736649 RepID=UPI001E625A7A|nr:acyltransferase family protein [Mycolicibacterium mengxianglii]